MSNKQLGVEELLIGKATLEKKLISTAFELTPLCNMNCKMCYLHFPDIEKKMIRPLRTLNEWINVAECMKKIGVLFILLTGGEPLLYPDFITLYQELIKMGFVLTINTNGTLITEKIADVLQKSMPRRVNITLYGANNDTYQKVTGNQKGYDQVLQGIQRLQERNIPIKLNCSMIRDNVQDTTDILKLSEILKLHLDYNTYMFPCHRCDDYEFPEDVRISPEEAARWDIQIKQFQKKDIFFKIKEQMLVSYKNAEQEEIFKRNMRCRAGKSSCWINWKGEMTPCVFLDNPNINIFDVSVEDAWNKIKEFCDNISLPEKCTTCKHRFNCHVCAASVYWENKCFDKEPQYLCQYMDRVIECIEKSVE